MTRTTSRNLFDPQCPIRNILARIGDKWSLLVIYSLSEKGTLRFKALQNELPDISQKMLTVTLRALEEDGLVNRQIYAQVPPKVEYTLTERAKSLLPHLNALMGWALTHMEEILDDRTQKQIAI